MVGKNLLLLHLAHFENAALFGDGHHHNVTAHKRCNPSKGRGCVTQSTSHMHSVGCHMQTALCATSFHCPHRLGRTICRMLNDTDISVKPRAVHHMTQTFMWLSEFWAR